MNEKKTVSRKIDDIDKKEYYTAPEDYFKDLPQLIQAKAVKPDNSSAWSALKPVLKFGIPVLLIVVLAYVVVQSNTENLNESDLIGEFTTEEVLDYLVQTDINSTDIVVAALVEGEIDTFFEQPTSEEEYIYEESILADIEWIEENLNSEEDI